MTASLPGIDGSSSLKEPRLRWWAAKIKGNRKRDRLQNRLLRANGWKVLRIWQHEVTKKQSNKAIGKLCRVGLVGARQCDLLNVPA
jgi:G:T-mismatch repair DNA endonuclease (very short patch repair protein)